MSIDFAEIWWLVCNLMSLCWRRISLKSDVVRQIYGYVYWVMVFSWTQFSKLITTNVHGCLDRSAHASVSIVQKCATTTQMQWIRYDFGRKNSTVNVVPWPDAPSCWKASDSEQQPLVVVMSQPSSDLCTGSRLMNALNNINLTWLHTQPYVCSVFR